MPPLTRAQIKAEAKNLKWSPYAKGQAGFIASPKLRGGNHKADSS